MVVEKFSQNLINVGVFKIYIAVGFFSTLIFFIFNSELFSPMQMFFGAVLITLALKGVSNLMLSYIVENFSLEKKKLDFEEKYSEDKINLILNQFISDDDRLVLEQQKNEQDDTTKQELDENSEENKEGDAK